LSLNFVLGSFSFSIHQFKEAQYGYNELFGLDYNSKCNKKNFKKYSNSLKNPV